MKKIIFIFILILSLPYIQATTYTGLITQLVVPPKIEGLGGASVGNSRDINSLYRNPAGISQISDKEILFFYKNYYQELFMSSVCGVYPLLEYGTVGAKFSYFGMPTDVDVAFSEIMGGLSYAYSIMNVINIGMNANYIHSQLSSHSASAFTIDLGGSYFLDIPKTLRKNILGIGFVVENIGTDFRFVDTKEPTNIKLILGLLYSFDNKVSFLYDIELHQQPVSHFGVEYKLNQYVQMRAGWNNTEQNNKLFFGTSVSVDIHDFILGVDYTVTPSNNLGVMNHNVSLSIKF